MSEQKKKRRIIGSVIKSKDPTRSNYIKMKESVTLKEGQIVSVESKSFQLKKLEAAAQAGKLSEELVEQIRDRLNKIPDWVLGDIVLVE